MLKTNRVFMALLAGLALSIPAGAADYEKYIPADTEAVIQFNFKQVLASPMLKDAVAEAKKKVAAEGGPLKELGFDPFKDLNHVIIAVPGGGNPEKTVVLVTGKFDVAKIEAAAEKAGAGDLKVHKVGPNKVFEAKVPVPMVGEQAIFAGFLDGTTVVVSNTKEGITETLDRKAGKTKGEVKKEMKDLIAKMDPKMSLSVAVLGTVAGVPDVSDRINNLTGGISLESDIKAEFVIAAKNADAAKEIEGHITQGLDQVKQILPIVAANNAKQLAPVVDLIGAIKVTTAGNNVTIKGQLSKEDIEKAIKKAGG